MDDEQTYVSLLSYPDETNENDFYAILGLARTPPPSDAEIRSAYRSLTFSFHPDKQPPHLREPAEHHFERIHEAYETLIDAQKRTVYDLLGVEGVRREWSATGLIGGGKAGKKGVGVRAKSPEEFRRWFLDLMKKRERVAVNSLVQSRGSITLGFDATDMISTSDDKTEFFLHVPTYHPSSYAVGYTFKTPFPTPEGIFGKMVGEEEDEQEGEGKRYDDEVFDTELTLNASISGPIEHLVQEAQLKYHDGREGTAEIPLRPHLSTQEIVLGASVSRVFGDLASTKGILGKWPFTFLGNSVATLSTHVLPFSFLHTSLTKAVTPIPGTNPIRVCFTNTFMNWPHMNPPTVGLAASKQMGQRKQAFCSWSSGTLVWPRSVRRILNPSDETGVEAGIAMAAFQQPSSLNVGVASQPPRTENVISIDDEDEDEEFQELQDKKRKTNQAAESWQVQIQATPAQGALTFGYGRNIFSGKPATEPIRSEWSSEGYYGASAEPEARSVRLELTTTLTLDASLAFSVEGVRQVSELTRMGLGVSLEGGNGLAVTISWSRLGQKIKVPITICSLENINWDIGLAAVVFPWLTYCAVDFGFLRPRERNRRRRLIARKQRHLKKLIPKKKADSAQAVELMTEQVQRRQAREDAQNGLVVTKAEYGYTPSDKANKNKYHDPADYEIIDVTVPVAALVDRGQLVIPRETLKFQLLGFHDPAPLLPKKLRVWYRYHDKKHFVEANDSEGIACPMRVHLT